MYSHNSEVSLYTIVLNDESVDKEIKFCSLLNSENLKELNTRITQKCYKRCEESCRDIYYSTEYIESKAFGFRNYYYIHLSEIYFKRFIYSPKLNLIQMFINCVNILSFWHGFTLK